MSRSWSPVARSIARSIAASLLRSFGHSAAQSLGRSVTRLLDRSIDRCIVYSVVRALGRSVARSLDRSVARLLGRSLARSLSRSVARSLGHSVARSLGRSAARSLTRSRPVGNPPSPSPFQGTSFGHNQFRPPSFHLRVRPVPRAQDKSGPIYIRIISKSPGLKTRKALEHADSSASEGSHGETMSVPEHDAKTGCKAKRKTA